MNARILAAAIGVAVLASLGVVLGFASSGNAKATAKVVKRAIYLSAVEWKGSASVAKEPYPTKALPTGGGYESFAPGHTELGGDTTKWAIETYRFDSAMVAACQGDEVTLNIFGVNSAYHDITIKAFNQNFRVSRGQLASATFMASKPGIFPIVCLTHMPSHRADLVVFRKGSGPC